MDLDEYFKKSQNLSDYTDVPEGFKSGFVAFLGRPNAGKSTLLNALVNKKIAIASDVANTTRHRFSGIVNNDNYQIVIFDTPGIHKPKDALSEELNISAEEASADVDVICVLIDATREFGAGDKFIIDHIKTINSKKFCIITKVDAASEVQIFSQIEAVSKYFSFDEFVPVSAVSKANLELLKELIVDNLEEGHRWFSPSQTSDVADDVFICELIREQVIKNVTEEVPHAVGVLIEDMEFNKKTGTQHIFANVIVERDSQVGIIVGKKGQTLKKIGEVARCEIEKYLHAKVNLQLNVKVKKNWRRDANYVRRFGYGQ